MTRKIIVANWKSHKTLSEAKDWLGEFPISNKEVILCPSFTLLSELHTIIASQKFPFKIGAQNISPFAEGAYTGEVSGKQIKEFAEYVIIGHSERRKYFGETNEVVDRKIEKAIESELIPIVCVSDVDQIQNYNAKFKIIIAYEPLFAIGTENPDTPENANAIAKKIKNTLGEIPVLYGGSVTAENVSAFTQMEHIRGVLVGSASLDPSSFKGVISNA